MKGFESKNGFYHSLLLDNAILGFGCPAKRTKAGVSYFATLT
jgi:hypothetical protein